MKGFIKLHKDFSELLKIVLINSEEAFSDYKTVMIRTCIKNGRLSTSDGKTLIVCNIKNSGLTSFDLKNGYYELSGRYLIIDENAKGTYPDINKIFDTKYNKYFKPDGTTPCASIFSTLSKNDFHLDPKRYVPQLNQLLEGSSHTIYFDVFDKPGLIKCEYPILDGFSREILFFMMGMKYTLPKIEKIKYNPLEDIEVKNG